jgi:hypothetical protein
MDSQKHSSGILKQSICIVLKRVNFELTLLGLTLILLKFGGGVDQKNLFENWLK